MATILIVDDSVIMRRNLKSLLVQAGHKIVAEASDGLEAYREYGKHLPDLVTMDITMPVMNGIDAVKKIIATYPDANIIMISALDQRSMIFEAIQNGAKHYILKPITVEKILDTINEVLKLKPAEAAPGESTSAGGGASAAAGKGHEEPLSIENKNGIFVIRIGAGLTQEKLEELRMAAQGFMYVKPLKAVFDFGTLGMMDETMFGQIMEIMNKLDAAGGAVKAVSANHTFIERLKESGGGGSFTIHTELAQVVF